MPHLSTPNNITTINYDLDWPYLQNPSNTTFAGQTQIDICRCPRSNLLSQDDSEPGHIYTRYSCAGPDVRFKTGQEKLWVLQAPHGPINMLRPATREERERRNEIHDDAEPAAYASRNLLFLTGPCPRGRYQAYATQKWLESISASARQHVSCISLLVQPYEEDTSDAATRRAYSELSKYILQHLPGFQTLYLNIWDDEMKLYSAASEFSTLLHRDDVRINVRCNRWNGESKEYNNARGFLEDMTTVPRTRRWQTFDEEIHDDEAKEDHLGEEDEAREALHGNLGMAGDVRKSHDKIQETSNSSPDLKSDTEDGHESEDDWTDAVMSPVDTDKDWQIL
jgi:hypothetical protein